MDTITKSELDLSLLGPEPSVSVARREEVGAEEPRRPQIVQPLEEAPPRGRTLAVERVMVRHSEAVDQLFGAMAVAQGQFEDLDRTRKARIESPKAKYSYEYETLADVIAATQKGLSENGLSVWQFPFPGTHSVTIRTLVGHKSGQWIYNDLASSIVGTDPQSIASGITYLCRYARKAILGIAAGWDDDGAAAALAPLPAPQPAQRKSAVAQGQASEVSNKLMTPSSTKPLPIGVILAAEEKPTGYLVRLDTGYVCAVARPELQLAILALKAAGTRVELVCRATKDARDVPTLEAIEPMAVKEET